jgi:protein pelota
MKVEDLDTDKGYMKLRIESGDDLWILSMLVEEGDIVSSKTTRDVSIEGSAKRRIPMTLAIRVIATEFQPFSGRLRIKGIIVEGPEEYGLRGSHHTLSIDVGMSIEILKRGEKIDEKILKKILKLSSRSRALIMALDHEEYAIALLQDQGVRYLDEGYMTSPSKRDPRSYRKYEEDLSKLVERTQALIKDTKVPVVVIASPAQMASAVADEIRGKEPQVRIIIDSVSMGGRAGVEEVLRRDTIRMVLSELSAIEAEELLREYLETISRDPSYVATGLEKVYEASRLGAIKKAAILEELLRGDREIRKLVNEIFSASFEKGYDVIITPQESPAGNKIRLLGGAIAILRFPIEYGEYGAQ